VQSLCGLLAEPMWGIISDTYGRRAALVGNSAGMVISSLLFTAVAWRLTDSEVWHLNFTLCTFLFFSIKRCRWLISRIQLLLVACAMLISQE
jgi:nitrate/nitrite transporter NarK